MLIDTFAAYVESRLISWAKANRGGTTSLSYPSTNAIYREFFGRTGPGVVDFSDLDLQTEQIIGQLRQSHRMSMLAIERVYIYGHEEKRESQFFKFGFDEIRTRFWRLAHPS